MKHNKKVDQDDSLVVGIGASAGGLQALKKFFGSLPEKTGMAFIVVVHLSPDHKSSMPELLQKHTSLEVLQVKGKTEIKADCVYVIPPKKNLLVKDNHIELSALKHNEHPPHVIDQLYRSLGIAKGNKAVCITLSGTGNDGVVGMKTIKEQGGLCVVQDPEEAQYSGMPQSAIDTGLADKILSVDKMPAALLDYRSNLSAVRISTQPDDLSEEEQEVLYDILEKVRKETRRDFRQYKQTTVLRRIERRMHVHNAKSLSEYRNVLDDHDEESNELFKDLLISVTHFFRDPEAFEALEEKVIPELFKGKDPDEELRVWVPGCATGEEAYSIAMLLREYAKNIDQPPEIKIFATDLDEHALQTGREGRYPESIADDLTPERLQHFFTEDNYECRVKEELRAMILFSTHDLLKNPPFSNLDLISCRNLLIYLNKDLQSQVFNLFHYAMKPGGYLWLGSSGSNLKATEQFKAVAKKYKIYQQRTSYTKKNLPDIPLQFNKNRPIDSRSRIRSAKDMVNIKELHQQLITQQYGPPSVVINDNEEVLHSTAGIHKYLNYPEGKPSQNIFDMIISELRHPLRNMFYQAKKEETDLPICKQVQAVLNGESHTIEINLHKVKEQGSPNDLMCIVFQTIREIDTPDVSASINRENVPEEGVEIIEELEKDLTLTKEQLQMTIEDYESTNQELRSYNEELQSMNEELQSTTEELETSQEELQSVNEELKTVNRELEFKVEALQDANNDLKNLMEASEVTIIFVEEDLTLRRFTSNASDLFNLTSSDEGRPLQHFTHRLTYDAIIDDINNVFENRMKFRKEVTAENGDYYIMRITPYRTTDGQVEGAVISFVDVTDLKAAEAKLAEKIEQNKKLQRQILKTNLNERWKLGEYLHDELAQSLVVAKMRFEHIRKDLDVDESAYGGQFDELTDLLDKNLNDVRDLSHEIIPVDIKEGGVVGVFRDLSKKVEKTYELNCTLEGVKIMKNMEDIETATSLYHVANEAVKNAAIHGRANNVRIALNADDQFLHMSIEDDGIGLEVSEDKEEGMGINIMRHRMELLGGTLEVKDTSSLGNSGVTINCKVPIEKLESRTE